MFQPAPSLAEGPDLMPSPVAGLVEYRPGSIVSRALLTKQNGKVTLFALDRGQGLSEHTASCDALLVLLEGDLRVQVGERGRYRLRAGEMMVLPETEPHSVHADEPSKMLLTLIWPSRLTRPGA